MDASLPDLERAVEREPAKVGVLAVGVLAGGAVLGASAAMSIREGWVDQVEDDLANMSEGAQFANFVAANVAMVVGGAALKEAIADMGREQFLSMMGKFGGGLLAFKLIVDGVRYLRRQS